MTTTKELKLKGDPPAPGSARTVTGAQLSSSGEHLSTTGSGIRQLFERENPPAAQEPIAATEEMTRPSFAKKRK